MSNNDYNTINRTLNLALTTGSVKNIIWFFPNYSICLKLLGKHYIISVWTKLGKCDEHAWKWTGRRIFQWGCFGLYNQRKGYVHALPNGTATCAFSKPQSYMVLMINDSNLTRLKNASHKIFQARIRIRKGKTFGWSNCNWIVTWNSKDLKWCVITENNNSTHKLQSLHSIQVDFNGPKRKIPRSKAPLSTLEKIFASNPVKSHELVRRINLTHFKRGEEVGYDQTAAEAIQNRRSDDEWPLCCK